MSRFVWPANGNPMPLWVRIQVGIERHTRGFIHEANPLWYELDIEFEVQARVGNSVTTPSNHELWIKVNK